jgi:hypothetical protein
MKYAAKAIENIEDNETIINFFILYMFINAYIAIINPNINAETKWVSINPA